MRYLLGIDFGGGASKATLISDTGVTIAESTVEYPTLHPFPGACEQDPGDWLYALRKNISVLLEKSGADPRDILAVAVDSATHSVLVCDGEAMPLRNCIHWTDSRSRSQAERLCREYGEMIFDRTFHKPDTIWTLPQLCWLRENEAELFSRIRMIFFEKDYIRYFLTDVFCTDFIEAEGSMLFDCRKMEWDGELCRLAGIDAGALPPVVSPTDIVGSVTKAASEITGLAEGTPVICGTTDTCMEILAAGAVEKGDMTVKLATAGRVCVITDRPYPDRNLVNYSHAAKGLWYPGTATKAAASSYRWYRDTFGGSYRELDSAAASVPVGCEGLMFHPYINGELTPYADPTLAGSFIGIRSTHTKAHFDRAVLEGVAFSLLDCMRYLDNTGIPHKAYGTLIGGGAKGKLWGQIVSDCLGIRLVTTESSDSSLGSAMLAGVAVGAFTDLCDAVAHCVKVNGEFVPDHANTAKYSELFKTYRAIHDALAPVYHGEKL